MLKKFLLMGAVTGFLSACGDSDSSQAPEQETASLESSSSENSENSSSSLIKEESYSAAESDGLFGKWLGDELCRAGFRSRIFF